MSTAPSPRLLLPRSPPRFTFPSGRGEEPHAERGGLGRRHVLDRLLDVENRRVCTVLPRSVSHDCARDGQPRGDVSGVRGRHELDEKRLARRFQDRPGRGRWRGSSGKIGTGAERERDRDRERKGPAIDRVQQYPL